MKRLTIMMMGMLAGCQAAPAGTQPKSEPVGMTSLARAGFLVIADPETGCQYLVARGTGGITPRYEAGGHNSSGSDLTRVRGCR